MSSDGSVTIWINRLKAGEQAGAQQLWEAYFQRLVGLARKKLPANKKRAADEEDVALSAFGSFCRGVERGQFPRLNDRNDLWHLLVVITARKAFKLLNHERRKKRGGGDVRGESAFLGSPDSPTADEGIAQIVGAEPTPAFAAEVAEEYQRLLDRLGDAELRSIVLWKMEGYTMEEIAAKLGCVPKTVERKLKLIRSLWTKP